MTDSTIDNSIDAVLDKIVIWQYDDSTSVCALIDQFKEWFHDVCGGVWDKVVKELDVSNPEDMSDYALSLLGKLIGVPRLDVVVGGETRTISKDFYRKIIVAKFRLLNSNGSFDSFCAFIDAIFGEDVELTDNQDMTVSLSWTGDDPSTEEKEEAKYLFDHGRKYIFSYPAGVEERISITGRRFWLAENATDKPTASTNGGGLDNSSFDWTFTIGE